MDRTDYALIVPSRKRPHNMETIRWLLPSATICIDEREAADYAPYVEKSKLLLHPPLDNYPKVLNWCMDNVKAPCLVFVEDDFQGVQVNVGRKRFIIDAEEILAIIENAMICARDLNLSTFCWSRAPNTTFANLSIRSISPVQLVAGAFGIRGHARKRHFDESLSVRSCVDWTLQTLLRDRCVFADVRFYFDFGAALSGVGGNVGIVTPEIFKQSSQKILEKWGKHVGFKAPAFAKKRDIAVMKIQVSRTNKKAQK